MCMWSRACAVLELVAPQRVLATEDAPARAARAAERAQVARRDVLRHPARAQAVRDATRARAAPAGPPEAQNAVPAGPAPGHAVRVAQVRAQVASARVEQRATRTGTAPLAAEEAFSFSENVPFRRIAGEVNVV